MTISEFKATLAADEINEFDEMGAEYAALLFGLDPDAVELIEVGMMADAVAGEIAEDWASVVDDED